VIRNHTLFLVAKQEETNEGHVIKIFIFGTKNVTFAHMLCSVLFLHRYHRELLFRAKTTVGTKSCSSPDFSRLKAAMEFGKELLRATLIGKRQVLVLNTVAFNLTQHPLPACWLRTGQTKRIERKGI
jgi:hypothetical protein